LATEEPVRFWWLTKSRYVRLRATCVDVARRVYTSRLHELQVVLTTPRHTRQD